MVGQQDLPKYKCLCSYRDIIELLYEGIAIYCINNVIVSVNAKFFQQAKA